MPLISISNKFFGICIYTAIRLPNNYLYNVIWKFCFYCNSHQVSKSNVESPSSETLDQLASKALTFKLTSYKHLQADWACICKNCC